MGYMNEQAKEAIVSDDRDAEAKLALLDYFDKHPQERLWQSIRNFSGRSFIVAMDKVPQYDKGEEDTFYWEGNNARPAR